MPSPEVEDQSRVNPRTRGLKKVLTDLQEAHRGYTDSFSDEQYYGAEKPYSTYLKEILEKDRRTPEDGESFNQSDENSTDNGMSEEDIVDKDPTSDAGEDPRPVEQESYPE